MFVDVYVTANESFLIDLETGNYDCSGNGTRIEQTDYYHSIIIFTA